MLANFFGKSNPVNIIIILLLFICFFLSVSIFLNFEQTPVDISIQDFLLRIGLFFLMLFFYNFILAKNKLTLYNSYGFLFFVLFFGFFPQTMLDINQVILNLLLFIFLRKVYSFKSGKDLYKKIFDSGFWLGVLFLIDPTTAVFGGLIFISIVLFQKINVRIFLIPMVGFLAPVFSIFSYYFWIGKSEEITILFLWYSNYNFEIFNNPNLIIPLLFIGFFTGISIVVKTPKIASVSGDYRKYWVLIIFNLIAAIVAFLIQKNYQIEKIIVLFFPISLIITNWLEGIKKTFYKEVVLLLFIGFPIFFFFIV